MVRSIKICSISSFMCLTLILNGLHAQVGFLLRSTNTRPPVGVTSSILFQPQGSYDIGLGTLTPTTGVGLHVHKQARVGTETYFQGTISDDANSFLRLMNLSGGNDEHIPAVLGQGGGRQALMLMANIAGDRDVVEPQNPMMTFNARRDWVDNRSGGASVINRPLFGWTNGGKFLMYMSANGNLCLGTVENPNNARLLVSDASNSILSVFNGGRILTGYHSKTDVPTAVLHNKGTVRFENLPVAPTPNTFVSVVADPNGNLYRTPTPPMQNPEMQIGSTNANALIPELNKTIKEQQTKIETLESRIARLEAAIKKLEVIKP